MAVWPSKTARPNRDALVCHNLNKAPARTDKKSIDFRDFHGTFLLSILAAQVEKRLHALRAAYFYNHDILYTTRRWIARRVVKIAQKLWLHYQLQGHALCRVISRRSRSMMRFSQP